MNESTRTLATITPHRIGSSDIDTSARTTSLPEVLALCERAGQLLSESPDPQIIGVVEALGRLAIACEEYGERALWHQQGYDRARKHCDCLLQDMRTMLDILDPGGNSLAPLPDGALHGHCRGILLELMSLLRSDTVLLAPERRHASLAKPAAHAEPAHTAPPRLVAVDSGIVCEQPITADRVAASPLPNAITPTLEVYLLSVFQVLLDGEPVQGWPNCRGKAIFKYLITHRRRPIPKEVLMDTFWPEADPDAARNNLNVAIYGLRKILARVNPAVSYVLFQDSHYLLNPDLNIWVDAEAFMDHVRKARDHDKRGELERAIQAYRAAETIYESELLVDDRYEDWLSDLRQRYQDAYLSTLERLSQHCFDAHDNDACISVCNKLITVDACNEGAHRQLMRCYSRLQQPHLAVRQFHYCVTALQREIQLQPQRETVELFDAVRAGKPI